MCGKQGRSILARISEVGGHALLIWYGLMRKRQSSKGVYIFQPLGTGPIGPWFLGKTSLLILLLSRVWWATRKDTGKQKDISFFSPSHFLWTFPPFPPPSLSLYFFCLWLNLKVSFFFFCFFGGGGGGAPKLLKMVITAIKLKDAYSLERKLWST